jgi:Tfp pilus assembly protein PilE
MKRNKGLTLIRLFPVAAMIGVITAIAVPSYLGMLKMTKIRSDQGDTKVTMTEVSSILETEIGGGPFTRIGSGTQECFESSDEEFSGDACQDIDNEYAESACSAYTNSMTEIICTEFISNNDAAASAQ